MVVLAPPCIIQEEIGITKWLQIEQVLSNRSGSSLDCYWPEAVTQDRIGLEFKERTATDPKET